MTGGSIAGAPSRATSREDDDLVPSVEQRRGLLKRGHAQLLGAIRERGVLEKGLLRIGVDHV